MDLANLPKRLGVKLEVYVVSSAWALAPWWEWPSRPFVSVEWTPGLFALQGLFGR